MNKTGNTNRIVHHELLCSIKRNCSMPFMLLVIVLSLFSCNTTVDSLPKNTLFTEVSVSISGVTFENKILESEKLHYYKYLYIFIGGGVAAADFNNDGLEDLFFTSNIYHNKLFLNKGNFKFEDITIQAGINKRIGFDAGVSIADVNNDGYLDIYICRAGWFDDDKKLANMLYINNGDLTFTEKASEFGIADTGRSIHSTFFDYDKDGDLDLYIANAPATFELSSKILDLKKVQTDSLSTNSFKGSDKLYNNDGNGFFTDVSIHAGILPDLGFGLNAQIGDLNQDGWPDIYVSNDFIGPDFAYLNNKDGTFSEGRNTLFKHISYYSMGSDIGDINNDGLSDMVVLDMSPEDYIRSKTTMAMMPIDRFNKMIKNNHHHQYMHNVLQLNNGNGTYSEIAHLSGIAKTDWSWSCLLADFDLDGYNDLYITNGVYRDVVDRDSNHKIDEYIKQSKGTLSEKDFFNFTQQLPQQKMVNYFFRNSGNLSFENKSTEWIQERPTFSNGAVYSDLDNDGDLDLVVNNIDENASVLKNNAREIYNKNFLQIKCKGKNKNKFGVGTKVKLYQSDGKIQSRTLMNSRGYLSSVSGKLHFGLDENINIKKIEILWPDGNIQVLKDVKRNTLLTIDYKKSKRFQEDEVIKDIEKIFNEVAIDYKHIDSSFNDFEKQLLLPHKLSQTGPAFATTDINADTLEDIFIGGAHNFPAQLLLALPGGKYKNVVVDAFIKDKVYEDIAACFFDLDNDGDKDLYVVSGSYEFDKNSMFLEDRLYINDGTGNFSRSKRSVPSLNTAGSIVVASDFDKDGDNDLFVGGRVIPGEYPYAPKSYLLINENGKLVNKTKERSPEIENIGMVTDAQWKDIDDDGDTDLILSGEWMGIEVLINDKGYLRTKDEYKELSETKGWWNTILVEDVDNDGDQDIIAGNLGLNYKFKATKKEPFHVYTNDFDANGTKDIVLAKYYKSKQVPVRGKSCTAAQMPFLKQKIKNYNDFANADMDAIFGKAITSSLHYEVTEFRSGIFMNTGQNEFVFTPFSIEAQKTPINSIVYSDLDGDEIKDILMAGNNYQSEVETTRSDAGVGVFLKGSKNNGFSCVRNKVTGFYADKDVRGLMLLKSQKNQYLFIVNNNSSHQQYKLNRNIHK